MLRSLVFLPCAAALLTTLSGNARAERPADADVALREAPDAPVRFRFDLTGGPRGAGASSANVSAVSFTPALTLDVGLQLGQRAALYARAGGGTLGIFSSGSVYLVGEWTPTPVLSVGTGIGYDGVSTFWVGGCDSSATHCLKNSWSGASVPLIFGINLGRRRAGHEGGPRLRIDIEAAGGYDPITATWGYHGFAGVGVAWR